MKIVHLNTLDTGGAATAAYRIHKGLQAAGADSKMVVLHKTSQDDSVRSILGSGTSLLTKQKLFQRWNRLLQEYPRRPGGLELFSDTLSPVDLGTCMEVIDADIIHLHWVAGLFDNTTFVKACSGKRLVWTLHDMNPFTGGCHYAGKCLGFMKECGRCPQLGSSVDDDLSRLNWNAKAEAYAEIHPTLVAPSRWLGDCIAKSTLMAEFPLQVIPYGLPLDIFHPIPEDDLRHKFSIPINAKIVLFGAEDPSNPRKGFSFLFEAIRLLDARKHNPDNLRFVVFGGSFSQPQNDSPYQIISLGKIERQHELAQIYALADLFVLPSLEDNLPNTAIEAMACGTPVVAFDSGGIGDIVGHKQTGYLARTGSPQQLCEGIDWILSEKKKGRSFTQHCRQKAEEKFSFQRQAQDYLDLYGSLGIETPAIKRRNTMANAAWPTISVVTPSFNQAAYLEACIHSVLDQDYPKIEYIVMDGGSSDGSREIIGKYAHRLAYWQSQPDNGHYWAVQEGINRSTGEIVTWLNSDDLFHPHAFKYAAAIFMERKDVHWLTGRPNSMNADGSDLFVLPQLPIWSRKRYLEKRYHHPFIQQEGTFWRRTLWEKAGARMQSGLKLAADLELWNRFFKYADLHSVDFPFAAYRVQGENRAIRFMPLYMKEAEQVIENELKSYEAEDQKRLRPAPIPITRGQILQHLDAIRFLNDDISDFSDSEHCNASEAKAQKMPLITSIVSTYNSERFIRGCLEDLLAQTMADQIEIVVIDSASEQGEGNVVRELQRKYDRIKYLRTEKRESVYAAWNRGIKLAKGKYITNANTDDRHRPDAFEKMVAVLEANPKMALVYADVIKTKQPNQTMAACTPSGVLRWFDWQRERLLTKGCFIGPQPMWRRNVHDLFGFFDESMTVASDYEYWLRISQVFDFRRIPEPLGLYLERDDSVEHAHREEKRAEERMVHQRYTAAAAAGKILSFAPLERLRQCVQVDQRESMARAVADIESISQYTAAGAAAGVRRLCAELTATLAQHARVSKECIERFIQKASHYFLTRGAAPLADATQANNDREANRTSRECSQKGVPMMPFAEKIQQGVRCLLDSGQTESAQWMLDKWLADYPGDAPAHHERAMLAHHQGDVNRAGMHFQKAAELSPGNALFQKSLGDFYHVAQKNIDAALAQYQKVLALTPDNLETLLITGHLCTASHRFDEARSYYQKVLHLMPNQADARQMLNRLSVKQAAQQPKETPESLYQSACRQAAQGQGGEAMHLLERVIALDPGHALAHNDLGVLAFESGDKDKARRLYEKACELAPYNGVFQKNLGDFYYLEQGDAEKALTRYVQALTLDPQDVESLMGTGHICMDLGRLEDARVFFDRTLEIEPWHTEARQYLQKLDTPVAEATTSSDLYAAAQSQAAGGDPGGAIRTLEQLVAKEPGHAHAHNDLGVLYYEQGDKQQALRFYEQAARLAPHDATFLKNLADFYFVEQGRTQDALRIYIRILESNREDIECLMAAGAICQRLDKNDDARTFLERVLEIEPWHAQAREDLNRIGNERSGGYGDYIATLGQRRVGLA